MLDGTIYTLALPRGEQMNNDRTCGECGEVIEDCICDVPEDDETERCPSCGFTLGDLRPCPNCGWIGICDECYCDLGSDEIDLCDQCNFLLHAAQEASK